MMKQILSKSVIFLDTSILARQETNEQKIVNQTEIEIVYNLCRILFKVRLFNI